MQTIKIIDLLNTNDKPKKIQYKNYIWILDENGLYDNKDIAIDLDVYISSVQVCDLGRNLIDVLNDEVEIISDKPKKIDKIIIEYDNKDEICKLAYMNNCYELNPQEVIILDKIEELRNSVNYLLEKSDKDD